MIIECRPTLQDELWYRVDDRVASSDIDIPRVLINEIRDYEKKKRLIIERL